MPRMILEYGTLVSRRRWPRIMMVTVFGCFALWVLQSALASARVELELKREAQRLRTVNAPTMMWTSTTPTLSPEGDITLPDGRRGHLFEFSTAQTPVANLDSSFATAVQDIRGELMGCTVVGTDSKGRPMVQIWALSTRAYRGICGNSSYRERCRANMKLWRNVGALMVDRGEYELNPNARAYSISVLGW